MTNPPDTPQPHQTPDPAAPPPATPDGTSTPAPSAGPAGDNAPASGQPWSTPSGDPLSPEPYWPPAYPPPAYSPGYAPILEPAPDYPPTSQFPAQPPPVNYAPPGYAPDYGQGSGYAAPSAYAPPGYPGYGQPPPKKSNAPIIAVILAVTLLLCGGIATAGVLIARNVADKADEAAAPIDDLPTAVPDLPGFPTDLPTDGSGTGRQITVTYEVTGDGPVSIVYIEKVGSPPVRLEDVKLPWKFTTEAETPALLSVVAIRVDTSEGSITCRALIDGTEVKASTSQKSNFATASCTHLAFD